MTEAKQPSTPESEWHRKFGAETNHLVWDLLAKQDRTTQEDEKMIHAAHTSHFHWSEVGTPINLTRGYWLISHVYAVLNQPQPALHYARRCLEVCQEHEIGDFDIAYAYEAIARGFAASGQKADCEKYVALAKEAGENIQNIEPEDKEIFFGDFEAGPWFGMKFALEKEDASHRPF